MIQDLFPHDVGVSLTIPATDPTTVTTNHLIPQDNVIPIRWSLVTTNAAAAPSHAATCYLRIRGKTDNVSPSLRVPASNAEGTVLQSSDGDGKACAPFGERMDLFTDYDSAPSGGFSPYLLIVWAM